MTDIKYGNIQIIPCKASVPRNACRSLAGDASTRAGENFRPMQTELYPAKLASREIGIDRLQDASTRAGENFRPMQMETL
jgi:hypothetical protein